MTALTLLMFSSAYLLGSISSAILVCKLFGLGDPRTLGSNNPGATNVLRIGGKLPASLVLIFDVLKGAIPVWISYRLGLAPVYLAIVAVTACLGHMYPLFFEFKGGKAVATALGALFPLGLGLAALLTSTWLIVLYLSGYSSLASIVTFVFAPIFTWWFKPDYTIPVIILSSLIILRHRKNIVRLIFKQESKIKNRANTK